MPAQSNANPTRIAAFAIENDKLLATIVTGAEVKGRNGNAFRYESIFPPERWTLKPSLTGGELRKVVSNALDLFDIPVDVVGISMYGAMDIDERILVSTPSDDPAIHNPRNLNFGKELASVLNGVPLVIENDATAAAMGEYTFGVGRGGNFQSHSSFAYIWISRGVNAGFLIDGRPLEVRFRPETGHLKAHRHERDDYLGNCPVHGDCITGMAGLRAFGDRLISPSLNDGEGLEISADYIAQLCAIVMQTLSPAQMVLGGLQMRRSWSEDLFEMIKRRYTHWVRGFPFHTTNTASRMPIVLGELGEEASLHGIAEIARTRIMPGLKLEGLRQNV